MPCLALALADRVPDENRDCARRQSGHALIVRAEAAAKIGPNDGAAAFPLVGAPDLTATINTKSPCINASASRRSKSVAPEQCALRGVTVDHHHSGRCGGQ